jgi:hypothetical protein
MPCYDPETHERPKRLEKKIHHLTEMLCWLCGVTDPSVIEANHNLKDWWMKHQEFDRIGEELARRVERDGIKSLTRAEQSHYWKRNDPEAP